MDVRLVAILLVLAGIVSGALVPGFYLSAITAGLAAGATALLWEANKGAPGGTSGALGLTMIVVGALVCFLVPAWAAYLLKRLFLPLV